ncbi:bifunctional 3'-5' exonuclease/DNA polymerase [Cytobacillus horneckiae]|uniref:bifunctional 3'-5' exonuclease/DNA polymerase n=1 Tax=Cytobacillus horneckiae TaxID=549687 RepID=UPI003D9A5F08
MKLGSLFGNMGTKTPLVKQPTRKEQTAGANKLAAALNKKRKPGDFDIDWGKPEPQKVKDYKAVLNLSELEAYLQKCQETGYASFDWETAPSDETRAYYEPRLKELTDRIEVIEYTLEQIENKELPQYEGDVEKSLQIELKAKSKEYSELKAEFLRTPLDPNKGEICTVSIAALPNESRVIPISHKVGKNIAPHMERGAAREAVLDLMDKYLFHHKETLKIAVNLSFETKYSAKYGRYILGRVADPLIMWVRCMQLAAPGRIKNPKKPASGWGLKPATKATFGVQMQDFTKLLEEKGVDFFDEIDASVKEGLVYSAEDADYGLQHYHYWLNIAKQLPGYNQWLHNIEMPFMRVIGLMEYWGMPWNKETAAEKYKEALQAQEDAANNIKSIVKEVLGLDVSPGKTGKTGDVKAALFQHMKVPVASLSDKGNVSLDEAAILDTIFMLENHLENLDEEKYLGVKLPNGWEAIDPDARYGEPGFNGSISKEERGAIRIAKRPAHPYKESAIRLLQEMMNIQKYTTLISSHIVGREKHLNHVTNRIHAGYSTFTETARTNSFNPNGQNVPRVDNDKFKIRSFFSAPPGKILFFIDFSGFELRLIAWKSNDEVMIELFNTGGDMHKRTAMTLTKKPAEEITKKERTDAKSGNFGITYGGTEHALQKTFKKFGIRKSLAECAEIVNAVKNTYPRIPEYQRTAVLEAREKGYAETIYGYKRLLKGINGTSDRERRADERRAGNTPIQGSAADIMKDCQNEVYDKIGEDTYLARKQDADSSPLFVHGSVDMIAQIHDEIIFMMDDEPEVVAKAGAWVKEMMERPPLPDFPVPIEAEPSVGYDWSNKMDLDKWIEERGGN